jgi:hypothetical protein
MRVFFVSREQGITDWFIADNEQVTTHTQPQRQTCTQRQKEGEKGKAGTRAVEQEQSQERIDENQRSNQNSLGNTISPFGYGVVQGHGGSGTDNGAAFQP